MTGGGRDGLGLGLGAERAGEAEDSAEEALDTPQPGQLGGSGEDILYPQRKAEGSPALYSHCTLEPANE